MNKKVVLDASAILALLFREPGCEVTEEYVQKSEVLVSAVNVSEVLVKQEDNGISIDRTIDYLTLMGMQIMDFDSESAFLKYRKVYKFAHTFSIFLRNETRLATKGRHGRFTLAASLRKMTKDAGLSLGDRACLALGKQHQCPVMTADRDWSNVDAGIEVILIR